MILNKLWSYSIEETFDHFEEFDFVNQLLQMLCDGFRDDLLMSIVEDEVFEPCDEGLVSGFVLEEIS